MKQVQLIQNVGVRTAGEVLEVDELSAANMVDNRKVAVYYDPENPASEVVTRSAVLRGSMSAQQVVDADEPSAPTSTLAASTPDEAVADAEPGETDPPLDAVVGELSMDNTKPEIVAAAVKAGKVTEDEAAALTKAQLLDKLGD